MAQPPTVNEVLKLPPSGASIVTMGLATASAWTGAVASGRASPEEARTAAGVAMTSSAMSARPRGRMIRESIDVISHLRVSELHVHRSKDRTGDCATGYVQREFGKSLAWRCGAVV